MSDNIPFEIQEEIMKKLPVKSLIKFRPVSKAWKSFIGSSDFIARYSGKMQHLLVYYCNNIYDDYKFVSIVDDVTFPQQKVSPSLPLLISMRTSHGFVGSSRGLMCLSSYHNETDVLVLWNILIRKAIAVAMPKSGDDKYGYVLCFGVCPEANDPKILKISCSYTSYCSREIENMSPVPWRVEIFTLSTGVWRSLYNNIPLKSIQISSFQVCIDKFLYWFAKESITVDNVKRSYNLIMSFDLTSEEFKEVKLPDTLAHSRSTTNRIYKIRKSLGVLECHGVENNPTLTVWMMEDGNSRSFAKLYTINTPDAKIVDALEFRNNGEPIIQISRRRRDSSKDYSLVGYEPYSKQINNLGIHGTHLSVAVKSYNETLLLLDQPDFIIYDKGKNCILKFKANAKKRARN